MNIYSSLLSLLFLIGVSFPMQAQLQEKLTSHSTLQIRDMEEYMEHHSFHSQQSKKMENKFAFNGVAVKGIARLSTDRYIDTFNFLR